MWLVDSGSPIASAMAGNGVLLGMLRTCLSRVVAADREGASPKPRLLCEPPCDRPTISVGVRSYNRNVTFREVVGAVPWSLAHHHTTTTQRELKWHKWHKMA